MSHGNPYVMCPEDKREETCAPMWKSVDCIPGMYILHEQISHWILYKEIFALDIAMICGHVSVHWGR